MNFEDLKFVRINNPGTAPEIIDMVFRRIPKELFEQVKDTDFNIDLLYKAPSRFIGNLNTMFYVLTDNEDKIKGILWAYVNILTEKIQVNILSIDKEYQFNNALEKTLEFIKTWQNDLKIECITSRPHAYEKNGWKQSERKILEID
jgi:hypothetical protein